MRITLRVNLARLLVARFLSHVLVGGEVLDTFCLRKLSPELLILTL